jgi:hypothetical protein
LISVNSSKLFWCFSVERPDGLVVRMVLPWSPDGDGAHMSGQDLTESGPALSSSFERYLYIVRTRTTFLLLSEAASVRTSSIHRPDGDPTEAIKCPDRRILFIPHKISFFWLFMSKVGFKFLAFCIYLSYFRYFSSLFPFSFL